MGDNETEWEKIVKIFCSECHLLVSTTITSALIISVMIGLVLFLLLYVASSKLATGPINIPFDLNTHVV